MDSKCLIQTLRHGGEVLSSSRDLSFIDLNLLVQQTINTDDQVVLFCPRVECAVELEIFANVTERENLIKVSEINKNALEVSSFICKLNESVS